MIHSSYKKLETTSASNTKDSLLFKGKASNSEGAMKVNGVTGAPGSSPPGLLRRVVSCEMWKLATLVFVVLIFVGDVNTWLDSVRGRSKWRENHEVGKNVPEVIGRSIKSLLEDPIMTYILSPMAHWIEDITGIAHSLKWLSANMVSVAHFFLGIFAGWLISSPSLTVRRAAVLLYYLRTVFDNYDGLVAGVRNDERRARGEHPDNFYSFGWYLDGFSDTFSALGLMAGIIWHLWHHIPPELERTVRKRQDVLPVYVPFQGRYAHWLPPPPRLMIILIIANYTVMCGLVSVCWNPWVVRYTRLLESAQDDTTLAAQLDALCWTTTQVAFWCWRLSQLLIMTLNATLFAIFIDKVWEYFQALRFWGYVFVLLAEVFTYFQIQQVRSHLSSS